MATTIKNEEIIIIEGLEDEQESVTEGENEDGEENPEIEVAEGNTNMAEKTTKEQTREEWLASLKPGDRVATYYHHTGYSVYVVARRTPSGRIILTTGKQFNKDGDEMTPESKWHRDHLEIVTPKVVAAIQRNKLVSAVCHELDKISNINVVNKLSDERLEELLAVLSLHAK